MPSPPDLSIYVCNDNVCVCVGGYNLVPFSNGREMGFNLRFREQPVLWVVCTNDSNLNTLAIRVVEVSRGMACIGAYTAVQA